MIPHGVEIFVGLEPIDLRWSFDRLAGAVAERVGREARSGALFVFFGKRKAHIPQLGHWLVVNYLGRKAQERQWVRSVVAFVA